MGATVGRLALTVLLLLAPGIGNFAVAGIVHESASLGVVPDLSPGSAIAATEYIGSRFSITDSVQVTAVGGHLAGEATMFAAIVALDSPTAFPSFAPSALASNVLAYTTLIPGSPSSDVRVPLSVLLAPGDYALIFGAGLFGTTGDDLLMQNNTEFPGASFFFWETVNGDVWLNPIEGDGGWRFVVEGNTVSPVPLPAPLALFGVSLAIIALFGWRRRLSPDGSFRDRLRDILEITHRASLAVTQIECAPSPCASFERRKGLNRAVL